MPGEQGACQPGQFPVPITACYVARTWFQRQGRWLCVQHNSSYPPRGALAGTPPAPPPPRPSGSPHPPTLLPSTRSMPGLNRRPAPAMSRLPAFGRHAGRARGFAAHPRLNFARPPALPMWYNQVVVRFFPRSPQVVSGKEQPCW